jgi:hypothetical protein
MFEKTFHSMENHLDAIWFEKFLAATTIDFLECLDGDKEDRERERKFFLAGIKENPCFSYPYIQESALHDAKQKLASLQEEIKVQEKNLVIKNAYLEKISEEQEKIRLLWAVRRKDMEAFQKSSFAIYGNPSQASFFSLIHKLRGGLTEKNEDTLFSDSATKLLNLLPIPPKNTQEKEPSHEEFLDIQKRALRYFSPILKIVDAEQNKFFAAKDIQRVFQNLLNSLGFSDWKVVIQKTSKAAINVQTDKKIILIPEKREMGIETLREICVHEIGCHVTRSENGKKSPLLLLSLGLRDYDAFEEGFATLSQQILSTNFTHFSGEERTLSIGLALGLDGKKRTFREVFTVLEKYYSIKNIILLREGCTKENLPDVAIQAWNATCRTFRGTTGETRGICFTKDLIYREGNISAWQQLGRNPNCFNQYLAGKYDPSQKSHLMVLSDLNIFT